MDTPQRKKEKSTDHRISRTHYRDHHSRNDRILHVETG